MLMGATTLQWRLEIRYALLALLFPPLGGYFLAYGSSPCFFFLLPSCWRLDELVEEVELLDSVDEVELLELVDEL